MKKILSIILSIFAISTYSQTNISGIINVYGSVSNIDMCSNEFIIDDASGFAVNDTVLILQMKGAKIIETNTVAFGNIDSLKGAGLFEYNIIQTIVGNNIIFKNILQNNFDVSGLVQVVSMPNYSGNVNVVAPLTAMDWNGSKGGVLVFDVAGDLTLNASIDVSSKGFRGGVENNLASSCSWVDAAFTDYFTPIGTEMAAGKGEGISNFILGKESGRGKQLNGGGGGNVSQTGGGGGAGYGLGGIGGTNNEPSFWICDGIDPGIGGDSLNRINRYIFSGGGGAGQGNNVPANIGGRAGGFIYLKANSIIPNGNSILANGQHGNNGLIEDNDGGAGGGAGGMIVLNVPTSINFNVSVNGGNGSSVDEGGANRCYGPGGGAGGGLILSTAGLTFTASVLGGIPGVISNSSNGCNGSNLGATAGDVGAFLNSNSLNPIFGSLFSSGTIVSESGDSSVCELDNVYFHIIPNNAIDSILWQINTGSGFTNILLSNNDTLFLTNVSNSMNGNLYRSIDFLSCSSDTSLNMLLTVNPLNTLANSVSICSTDSIFLQNAWQNTNGIYLDTIQSTILNQCDTIRTTTLTIDLLNTLTNAITICSNDSVFLQNAWQNTSGIYLDTIQSTILNQCDTILTTTLTIDPISVTNINDTICSNDTYTLPDGVIVNTAGIYNDTFPSTNLCDSIIITNLTVNPVSNTTVNVTIGSNSTYTLPDGQVVNTTGVYLDTLPAFNTCDSVITTNLTVTAEYTTTVTDTICSNQTYTLPDGEIVNLAATYIDTIPASNLVDSIVTTHLTVNPISTSNINISICGNETYTLPDGTIVSITGVYNTIIPAFNTCDSVITTNLTVFSSSTTTYNVSICSNETYTLPDGQIVNTAGSYIDTFSNVNLCDSIITTNLSINSTASSVSNVVICNNETYMLSTGQLINTPGIYFDTISAFNTCDSFMTINLSVIPISIFTVNATICSNENYFLLSGQIVNTTGAYNDTLVAANGCDSIVTTNLTVNPIYIQNNNVTICSNETYTLPSGIITGIAGNYSDTLSSVNNCDSIIITVLNVNPISTAVVNDTICSDETYTLPNGLIVNTSGAYFDTLVAANFCDYIVTTNLVVYPNIVINQMPVDITVCEDSSALLYIDANGIDMIYQWQSFNGLTYVNIPGEINDTISFANVNSPLVDKVKFRVVITSFCGNFIVSDTATINVAFNLEVYTNPANTNVCENSNTTFSVFTNSNEENINWQVNSGSGFVNLVDNSNYSGSNSVDLQILNTPASFDGNTYRLILSDNCGVADTTDFASLNVLLLPVITAQENDVIACLGNDVQLFVTGNYIASYQWQINTGTGFVDMIGETNDVLNLLNVQTTLNGNLYQCIVSNSCISVISNSVGVTVNNESILLFEPTDIVICPEDGFNFNLTVGLQNVQIFQWQINTGSGFIDIPSSFNNINYANTNNLLVTVPFDNIDGADFRLVYIDDCGFQKISSTYNVLVNEPLPFVGIDDVTMCERKLEVVEVDYAGTDYIWDDAENTVGRFFEPQESGEYKVTFIQNSSQCKVSDIIKINIKDCLAECEVVAPTGFSPNSSEGFNDAFNVISGCELDVFEFIIVDRWGEIIFKSTDVNSGWDGTFKGFSAPVGNYAWYLTYSKKGLEQVDTKKGTITIIR